MSHYHSIYATQQRRPARWPWVVLILLIVGLSGGTGAMIARGETPRTLLDRIDSQATERRPEPAAEVRSSGVAAVPEETPAPTATATEPAPDPTEPSAGRDRDGARGGDGGLGHHARKRRCRRGCGPSADAASPAAGGEAASIPLEDASSPIDVVETYGARWVAGDYGGLYDLLTTDAQATISRQDFIDRYTAIQAEAGLLTVKFTVNGDFNLQTQVPVKVEFTSSKVGSINEENSVQLAKEGDDWKVAWTPSLIFNKLGDGCVDFTAEAIRRGSILDRNGKPLAKDGTISVVGIIPGLVENANRQPSPRSAS